MGCAAAGDLNAWSASSSDHTSTASADLTPKSWPPVHAPPPPLPIKSYRQNYGMANS